MLMMVVMMKLCVEIEMNEECYLVVVEGDKKVEENEDEVVS